MVGKHWLFSAIAVALVSMLVAFGALMRSTASASPAFQVETATLTTTATEPITSTVTITETATSTETPITTETSTASVATSVTSCVVGCGLGSNVRFVSTNSPQPSSRISCGEHADCIP